MLRECYGTVSGVLREYCGNAMAVLREMYRSVIRECYRNASCHGSVMGILRDFYSTATGAFPDFCKVCYRTATGVLWECYGRTAGLLGGMVKEFHSGPKMNRTCYRRAMGLLRERYGTAL